MVKPINGEVVRNEYSTIPYTWIRGQQPSRSICFMLPGLGYTTQRPLFHYATGVCLNQNIDVLHINYQFSQNEFFKKLSEPEQDQWMHDDVKAVVDEVLKDTVYERVVWLSKSIGSIPMAKEWKQSSIQKSMGIWLTPLIKIGEVYDALSDTDVPSLCVIGDQDHHYLEDRISSLKNNDQVTTIVIPNADHGLEINGDIPATMDAIKEVTLSIQEFLIKN